jgi:broad specificity phosphatase PhoE
MNQLYLIRHAPTRLNDPKNERSRGWGQFPPDPEKLAELAPQIAEVLKGKVAKIVASDLPRAALTAKAVAKEIGVPFETTSRLRTWNTGDMTGKSEKEVEPLKKKYINNPDQKPAGGEPFGDFSERWHTELRREMRNNEQNPDKQHALIVHGNMEMSAKPLLEGTAVTDDHYESMNPPGTVLLLTWEDMTKPKITKVFQGEEVHA